MNRLTYCLLLMSLIFFGCKEEKDQVLPTVSVIQPGENSIFQVLDTIRVRASISDNENIEQVSLQLEELSSGRKVGKTKAFYPNSSSFELDDFYIVEDSLLRSGDYYFRVQAFDGENQNSAFSTIRLQGISRKKLGFYLLLDNGSEEVVYEVDERNQSSFLLSAGQCDEIAFDSRAQMLWFADLSTDEIGAYQVKEDQLFPKRYPNGGNTPDPILDLLHLDGLTYVSTQNGFVQAFNGNFSDVFTYTSTQNSKVEEMYPIDDRLMVRETDGLGQNQSFLYLFSSGGIDSQSANNEDVIGFGSRRSSTQSAFQFVKDGQDMEVREYNLNSGESSFLLRKLNFPYHDLIQIQEYEYIFYNNSEVVTYNVSTNFKRTLASGLNDVSVAYDEFDNLVYIASGNDISIFSYQQGNLSGNYSATFPIVDLKIRYNK